MNKQLLHTFPQGEFAGWLYTKVADVCYDLLKYMEQYDRYLDHLKIVDVSTNPSLLEKKLSEGTVDSVDSNRKYTVQGPLQRSLSSVRESFITIC